MSFNLEEIIRPNIRSMNPYSSARDEFSGSGAVLLDANENPYNSPLNRYPDPRQQMLKEKIGSMYGLTSENIFLGNGSDEAIDLLIRISCEPGIHKIVSIEPSYGMYRVAAETHNSKLIGVLLNEDFSLNSEALLDKCTPDTRIVFLCSPNNPTSNLLDRESILYLSERFHGLVVLDEAYVEFSGTRGMIHELKNHPNLVILRTLSKSWGLAGIRLGMALGSADIISYLTRIKYPYNLNTLTQEYALKALNDNHEKDKTIRKILEEREYLSSELKKFSFVEKVYPSDANFLLVKVRDAKGLYNYLRSHSFIIRDRSNLPLCEGCLRISIGTKKENEGLLRMMKNF
jgi:histidinol-phosphate aminotransferase